MSYVGNEDKAKTHDFPEVLFVPSVIDKVRHLHAVFDSFSKLISMVLSGKVGRPYEGGSFLIT